MEKCKISDSRLLINGSHCSFKVGKYYDKALYLFIYLFKIYLFLLVGG